MIGNNKMKEIHKGYLLNDYPKCPNCNSTLQVELIYHSAKICNNEISNRNVTIIAKRWKCEEYGEITYDEFKSKYD